MNESAGQKLGGGEARRHELHIKNYRKNRSLMSSWCLADLRRLDKKFAEEGVPMHKRPLRAAMELLDSTCFARIGDSAEAEKIIEAYATMVPETISSWPGLGIGLIAAVDRVRKVIFPIVYGQTSKQPWQMARFSSVEEWELWCRQDVDIAAEVAFAAADIHDFTVGLSYVDQLNINAQSLWHMSRSNLEDIANNLPTSCVHDSVIQPIVLVAELSIKAALVSSGVDVNSFKGSSGHNIGSLAMRLTDKWPHRDDVRLNAVVESLPPYVASRYAPAGLTRLQVIKLALGTQFIAASAIRRITPIDLAAQMEAVDWPGLRSRYPY